MTEPLVLRCDSSFAKETPSRVPSIVEVVCESGVMRVDLSRAEFESAETDVELECDTGLLVLLLPRDVIVELGDHASFGGKLRNQLRVVRHEPGMPVVYVHVRNGGGVITLRHPRRLFAPR